MIKITVSFFQTFESNKHLLVIADNNIEAHIRMSLEDIKRLKDNCNKILDDWIPVYEKEIKKKE